MEGHRKFLGGGGLKSQNFRSKVGMKLNWNFLGGQGVQNKKPSVGGVWIFSGTAHFSSRKSHQVTLLLKAKGDCCFENREERWTCRCCGSRA